MIELAQRTAKRCNEKREERALCPVEPFDTAGRGSSRIPWDMVDFPVRGVALARKPKNFLCKRA